MENFNYKYLSIIFIIFFLISSIFNVFTYQKYLDYSREQKNIELVRNAFDGLFNNLDVTAIDRYWGEPYIQHNPSAPNGAEALKNIMKEGIKSGTLKKNGYEIKRIVAQGDLVVVHSRVTSFGNEIAVVDIVRIKDGKMVEHWDVGQVVPEKSANDNTMF